MARPLVLVVDNDPDILETFVDLVTLEFPEFDVVTAGSGREALERLQGREPRLIISDYRMPDMDGVAFLQQVQAQAIPAKRALWTIHETVEPVVTAKKDGVAEVVVGKTDVEPLMALLRDNA